MRRPRSNRTDKRLDRRVFWGMSCISILLIMLCLFLAVSSYNTAFENAIQFSRTGGELFTHFFHNLTISANSIFTQLQASKACDEWMGLDATDPIAKELLDEVQEAISTVQGSSYVFDDLILTSPDYFYSRAYLRNDLPPLAASLSNQRGSMPLGIHQQTSFRFNKPAGHFIFGHNFYSNYVIKGQMYLLFDLTYSTQLPLIRQKGYYQLLRDANGTLCFLGVPMEEEMRDPNYALIRQHFTGASVLNTSSMLPFEVQFFPLDANGNELIHVIDSSQIAMGSTPSFLLCLLLAVLLLITNLLWNLYLQTRVIRPLVKLNDYIIRLQSRESADILPESPPSIQACNEVTTIYQEFMKLLYTTIELLETVREKQKEIYETELLRINAEIEALRSQINPHFLYNTLELVRADALAGKMDQVSEVIAAMGHLYRYTISGSAMVPLHEEIGAVRAYIGIQQHRFKDNITAIYDIADNASELMVPKMTLQPLVENSFIHGLDLKNQAGTIYIGARMTAGTLSVIIRDDGMGFAPDVLKVLEEKLQGREPIDNNSIGVTNVYKRLQLQYGHALDFLIDSVPGDGACITIRIQCK